MPYYCTVPRCTSMAGKAKNVSFHQFPRDEELARLWNKILKRGKPYTKYSKVCSLHFRPEDYTITSVGKNKGQWRTLRKDAIPSQNLPSESPVPTTHHRTRSTGAWLPNNVPTNVIDPRMQHHMAQAIYMQTMLAMQAATNGAQSFENGPKSLPTDLSVPHASNPPDPDVEQILQKRSKNGCHRLEEEKQEILKLEKTTSYKCQECSKCFKDPDVFVLHRRTHTKHSQERLPESGKENVNSNSEFSRQETLRANPILANLLKSDITQSDPEQVASNFNNVFDVNNILSIENQIMTALAANMESYIRNLTSMLAEVKKEPQEGENERSSDFDEENDREMTDVEQNIKTENELKPLNLAEKCQEHDEDECRNEKDCRVVDKTEENDCQTAEKDCHITEKSCNIAEEGCYIAEEGCNIAEEGCNIAEEGCNVTEKDCHITEKVCNITEKECHVTVCQNTETVCQTAEIQCQNAEKVLKEENQGSKMEVVEPNCDKEDLNDSKDSTHLVIDENA